MNNIFKATESELARGIGEQRSEGAKYQMLRVAKCKDQAVWGPVLARLLEESGSERLKALALVRLRAMSRWPGAVDCLIHCAADESGSQRIRMLAAEGLMFFRGKAVSEALVRLIKNPENPGLRRIALSSLKTADPKACRLLLQRSGRDLGLDAVASELEQAKSPSRAEQRRLAEQEERTLRQQLFELRGEDAFGAIQKLAGANERETARALIARFPTEEPKNKCEIMLALASIAERNRPLRAEVEQFLRRSAKIERTAVRYAAKQCLSYLKAAT